MTPGSWYPDGMCAVNPLPWLLARLLCYPVGMGTTQQQPKNPAQKSYDDWETRWKRDQDHKIQEKKALLQIVMAGLEYMRLTQQKLVVELEELATAKPPTLHGLPYETGCGPIADFEPASPRPPAGGAPKTE